MLDKSFQEILYRIDNWINEGSGWMDESVDTEYVNISIYSPLSGSTYLKLPRKLKKSMKDLINIKNNDNKCFRWCHSRHLNPLKIHPERISKPDKNTVNNLDYKGIEFPVSIKGYSRLEQKNNICINVFCYENGLMYPAYVSNEKCKNCMDLLMITEENNSHYVYIKDFNRFMCNKTKHKNKKYFCRYGLQSFSSEKVLVDYKEVCLKINGKHTVKLRSGSIKFKNYFKQLFVPFKIYADFECSLKGVQSNDRNNNIPYTKKYQDHIPNSFAYKAVCIDDKFSKPIVLYRVKNAVYEFIDAILKEYNYCKKRKEKHFKKSLIMSTEDEERFQLSNKCCICDKLFDVADNKLRDDCHITGKYRVFTHWSCNVNVGFTIKVLVIFHNLRGYDSHLII